MARMARMARMRMARMARMARMKRGSHWFPRTRTEKGRRPPAHEASRTILITSSSMAFGRQRARGSRAVGSKVSMNARSRADPSRAAHPNPLAQQSKRAYHSRAPYDAAMLVGIARQRTTAWRTFAPSAASSGSSIRRPMGPSCPTRPRWAIEFEGPGRIRVEPCCLAMAAKVKTAVRDIEAGKADIRP